MTHTEIKTNRRRRRLWDVAVTLLTLNDCEQSTRYLKLAFHDADTDTDTDTDILARILVDASDTRDFVKLFLWQAERHAGIFATILSRMSARMSVSVSVSVSASWNASLSSHIDMHTHADGALHSHATSTFDLFTSGSVHSGRTTTVHCRTCLPMSVLIARVVCFSLVVREHT